MNLEELKKALGEMSSLELETMIKDIVQVKKAQEAETKAEALLSVSAELKGMLVAPAMEKDGTGRDVESMSFANAKLTALCEKAQGIGATGFHIIVKGLGQTDRQIDCGFDFRRVATPSSGKGGGGVKGNWLGTGGTQAEYVAGHASPEWLKEYEDKDSSGKYSMALKLCKSKKDGSFAEAAPPLA